MDSNNWRPAQGEPPPQQPPAMDAGDWRSTLQPDSRHRIVNKIMDTLKRHLPFSGHEGLNELKKIAVRFEEKIYTAATSQSDYLRKISLKMLTMETKSQGSIANPLPLNPTNPLLIQAKEGSNGSILQLSKKEREREIGYPIDDKHVAHIGWDGPSGSGSARSWILNGGNEDCKEGPHRCRY